MSVNDTFAVSCFVPAVLFMFLAVLFAALREKGAMLISGFNTLPKKQREEYDAAKMSRDMRNRLVLWAAILLAGAILSWLIVFYFAIAALAVWLFLFFRNVHIDAGKAFERYRKPDGR